VGLPKISRLKHVAREVDYLAAMKWESKVVEKSADYPYYCKELVKFDFRPKTDEAGMCIQSGVAGQGVNYRARSWYSPMRIR
jgi:hypothetical protein